MSKGKIECFHSRGQHLCKFIGTKGSVCIRKEFNSQRIVLGHQHGLRFIVLRHQYGRRYVMGKHSIHYVEWEVTKLWWSRFFFRSERVGFLDNKVVTDKFQEDLAKREKKRRIARSNERVTKRDFRCLNAVLPSVKPVFRSKRHRCRVVFAKYPCCFI